MMIDRLKRWFGLRCFLLFCPGRIVTRETGKTFWQCVNCGACTKPE